MGTVRADQGTSGARHQVVIVGGGFGGLYAAQELRKAPVDITIVDRRNFHLFQPLLYQVATGGLNAGDIAAPIRAALKKQRNARVVLGTVTDLDPVARRVILTDGELRYDTLILAAGLRNHYFGHDEWAALAPGLKTLEDAYDIRRRVLSAFENAEMESDPVRRQAWLTFVVVGAGATGVELAGALGELAHGTLRGEFRNFNPRDARILLIDAAERPLPAFPETLSRHAAETLSKLGVEMRTRARVVDLTPELVDLEAGGTHERIEARTVLWAAGVRGSPLGEVLARRAGVPLDGMGRVVVQPDLTVPGFSDVMVIGDLAHVEYRGEPLPGVAPAAMQQGRYAARLIRARLKGHTPRPFRYFDKGSLATIGRSAAVANFRGFKFWGLPAWLLWLVVHIVYLIEFENRLLVLIQWFNNYVTMHRGSRLILDWQLRREAPFRTPE